jgi:hypothetical protein
MEVKPVQQIMLPSTVRLLVREHSEKTVNRPVHPL